MLAGHQRIKGSAGERAQARDRLRAELLAAARAIADESGGFEKVTVRSVADRIGYTSPIVYQYFANKRALLVGLVDLGFAELADQLRQAQCPEGGDRDPDGLVPVALAYWEFATDNPFLYRLMHTLPDLSFGTAEAPPAARECFQVLKAAVLTTASGHLSGHDEDAATDIFWAHLHGLVSLVLDGRIKGGAPRGRDLLIELTRAFTATTS